MIKTPLEHAKNTKLEWVLKKCNIKMNLGLNKKIKDG